MSHKVLRSLSFGILSALTALAQAATPVPSEQDFLGDLPVVLSVSRLAQPQSEAPGSVTVIDGETIRLSGAREIVDLFRLVPGFQVGYSGSNPRVYYHGALDQFGQHMQVLIDGRSVYSPFFLGGVNWSNIPLALEDIDHIEVLRGSNSAAYGADAFLGVANIVSKHPSQTPGCTLAGRAGGPGVEDKLLRYGGKEGELSYRVTLGQRSDQGFDHIGTDRDMRHFNLRADWRANLRDEFQFQAGAVDTLGGAGYPNVNNNHNGDMPRQQRRSSAFVQAKWQRTLSPDEDFHLAWHHMEERSVDNFIYGDPIFQGRVTIDYGGTSSRDDLEMQHTFSPRPDMRIVWGAELRRDRVKSVPLYATQATLNMDMGRLFENWEWRLNPSLLFNLGTSLEHNSLTGSSNSPRAMLSYHLTPEQTFRMGVSRATRAPSIFEEKANLFWTNGVIRVQKFLATGAFQSEEILSREIGYLGTFRSLGLTTDVRLFHEKITGLGTRDCPQACDYKNLDHPSIRGVEWQVEFRPAAETRIILNQAFMRIASQYPLPTDTKPSDRQAAPTHSTSLALFQKLPQDMTLSAMLYATGAMYWPGSPEPKLIPGYSRLDLRLAYPFRAGTSRGEFSVTAQNLGAPYFETDTYYLFERRILAGISLSF
jgi:iron complex outermembrane receptor protein